MKLYIVLLLKGQFPSTFWTTCSDLQAQLKKHHFNASKELEILILTLNNTEKSFLLKILDLNLLTSICLSTSARQVWLELSVMSAEHNLWMSEIKRNVPVEMGLFGIRGQVTEA